MKKSGGEPGKSGRETEGKPGTPTSPEHPTNPNPLVESGNPGGNSWGKIRSEESNSRPRNQLGAAQDEFHTDSSETKQ